MKYSVCFCSLSLPQQRMGAAYLQIAPQVGFNNYLPLPTCQLVKLIFLVFVCLWLALYWYTNEE